MNLTHFFSGCGRRAHFQGALLSGASLGIVIEGTSKPVLYLAARATSTTRVFVDSGAFTAFTKGIRMDWDQVMGKYNDLADQASNPSNLYLVAPDVIGNYTLTMHLQLHFLGHLKTLTQKGVNVILPIQRGATLWTAARDFHFFSQELGEKMVLGIPSNKMAWGPEEAADIVKALSPSRVHLLGIGPGAPRFKLFQEAFSQLDQDLVVFTDSVPSGFRDFSVNRRCKEIRKEEEESWKTYDDTEVELDGLRDLSDNGLKDVAGIFGLDSFGISTEDFISDVRSGGGWLDLEGRYSFLLVQPHSFLFEQAVRTACVLDTGKDVSLFRTVATREHISSLNNKYGKED